MTWGVGLGDSLQSRFAGFMDLTLAEWAALEDSEDKYLFGAYVAMGNITDAKMTPEEARQDAEMVMDNALSYWEKNNTKLPSDLDISWVCCSPSEEFWKLNMDNFSCWMIVGSISASDSRICHTYNSHTPQSRLPQVMEPEYRRATTCPTP